MDLGNPYWARLSDEDAGRLERLTDRFEDAWQRGERPAVRDYLPAEGPLRRAVLAELAHTDLEYRLRAGEPARAETYLEEFPELRADPDTARELLRAEDELRQEVGPSPARLGRFLLREQLGAGACGAVYRAFDPELQRTVAVKVPHAGALASPGEKDRFLREARSAARLRHPGIVAVHDAGEWRGTCYLVSEFVPGGTLAQRLAAGRPPYRESAELVAQVAEALHYAHEQGVIHRDLKPANILLHEERTTNNTNKTNKEEERQDTNQTATAAGAGPSSSSSIRVIRSIRGFTPKISDFGLARRPAEDATLTAEGEVLGTPAYLSPEQARGDRGRVDARSDVYSLGVLLYQLLTGELPFRGSSRMVLAQVLEDEPRPPRRLADDVPRDLETVCLRAMAKEPAGRYPTAAALAEDLRRFLRGEPVRARPVGPLGRLRRWCRRQPLAAALVLVTALGFAAVTWQWHRAESSLAEAERQRRRAEDHFQQSHQMVNDFARRSADSLLRSSRATAPAARELMAACLKYYRGFLEQHGDDPALRAEADRCRLLVAYFTYQLGPNRDAAQEAIRACARARVALRALPADDPANARYRSELAWVDLLEGQLHFDRREFPQALECLERARAAYAAGAPPPQDDLAAVTYWIGLTQRRLQRPAEACRALEQAIALYQALPEAAPATAGHQGELSRAYYHLGEALRSTGREAEALDAYGHVFALSGSPRLKSLPDPELLWVQGRSCYAVAKSKEKDRPREAIPYFERAAELYQRQVWADPPGEAPLGELGNCYQHLGDLYRQLGDVPEAVGCYRKALPVREQRWQMDTWLGRREALVQTCWSLGQALEQLGRPGEALAAYLRAVDPRRVVPKEGKPEERRRLRALYRDVAVALRRHGRPAEAEMVARQEEALGAYAVSGSAGAPPGTPPPHGPR